MILTPDAIPCDLSVCQLSATVVITVRGRGVRQACCQHHGRIMIITLKIKYPEDRGITLDPLRVKETDHDNHDD